MNSITSFVFSNSTY